MRLKPLIVFVLFFQLFTIFLAQIPVSDTYGIGNSPRPSSFCTNQTMIDYPLTKSSLIYQGKSTFNTNGNLVSLDLANTGVTNAQNYVYVQAANDWQNGFVTTFNMVVANPTCYYFDNSCLLSIGSCWWRASTSITSRCGADGFAIILRYSQIDGPGLIGGGLGYKGIYSALAIEFDLFTNTDQNDPTWDEERHISVIIRAGQNFGDETDRLAWNYRPLNFKSNVFEGYLVNPTYTIQYLNRNLRIYINNILQLEYYDPLDAQSILGMPTAISYLGITASTGALTNDIFLTNWDVKKVTPTYSSFVVNLDSQTPSFITAGDYIYVDIFMYDSCNNRYVPYLDNPTIDSPNFVSMIQFNNGCSLMSVSAGQNYRYFETGPAFQAVVSCLVMGVKTIEMSYKGSAVGNPLQVTINAGSLWGANITFPYGTVGSVDQTFNFTLTPFDRGQNLAQTNSATLRTQMNIFWTNNPADTITNYNILPQTNGNYIFVVSCQLSGQYAIQSKLLWFAIGQEVFFTINTGAPDSQKSLGQVFNANYQSMQGQTTVVAGTAAYLVMHLYDKSGNTVILNQNTTPNYQDFISEMGIVRQLTGNTITWNAVTSTYDLKFTFITQGTNILIPQYLTTALNCPFCQFQVTAGTSNFNYADLFVPNANASILYAVNPYGNNYTIVKPQTMAYLLVLKDSYGNTLSSVDVTKYTAILSGNNMNPIALNLSAYSIGAQVSVPSTSLAYFQNLVGRTGYVINVTQTIGTLISYRSFNVTIVSDGSDGDADNGPYNFLITSYYWINSPANGGVYATAGVRYTLAIQLNTFSGMRYNSWINASLINFSMTPFNATAQEVIYPIQIGPKPGVYTVDFVVTIGGGLLRQTAIYVNSSKTLRAPSFKSYASTPAILTVDNSYLNSPLVFKQGIVLLAYNFLCYLTDVYRNPVNTAQASNLNLLVNNSQFSYVPTCASTNVGSYYCSFIPQAAGNASVSSPFFANPYSLMMGHGSPNILNSDASIMNNLTNPLIAGVTITFRITPKDSSGANLLTAETKNYVSNFSLTLTKPDGSLVSINIDSTNVDGTGEIITNSTITQIGQYSFLPKYNGNNVVCEICAFTINYGNLDYTQTKVLMLVNQDRVIEIPSQVLQIDNTQIVPIFYMQFYDQYQNQRPVSSDLYNFNAILTVPGSDVGRYIFTASLLSGDYKFELMNNLNQFQFELSNNQCYLDFSATSTLGSNYSINVNFTQVILTGSANDSSYTNNYPDPNFVKILPNTLSFAAGQFVSVTVELRAANGLLFKDEANLGWYADAALSTAFTLQLGALTITNPGILKAKQYGTYTVTFTSTQATYNYENLVINYQDPSKNTTSYVKIVQTVNTTVTPAGFSFLVSLDSSLVQAGNCKASNNKVLTFFSYDNYSNVIININTGVLGFKLKNTNPLDSINPSVTANANTGLITLSMLCRKAGTVTLTSIQFLNTAVGGSNVASYQFNIIPGTPNPLHSMAYLTKSTINAGDTVNWVISPSDIYDNAINVTVNDPDYQLVLFNSSVDGNSSFLTSTPIVSNDGSYLYWTVNLTVAGTHVFTGFYQNQLISSTLNQITVNALSPFFANSILAKYNSKTSLFEEYQTEFQQDITQNPIFRMDYYDIYNNSVSTTNFWNLEIYLDSPTQNITEAERIEFCLDSKNYYEICTQNAADQSILSQDPVTRYSILVSNLLYNITVINSNLSSQQSIYGIYLQGLNGDNSTKNLPVDPDNTIITPTTTLVTTAGQSTTFTIELRTTLANYRRNEWFDPPMPSLQLQFKYNQSTIYYNITKGDITDRYFVVIMANETHPIEDPNIITLLIQSTPFIEYQPKWIVNPAPISAITPVNLTNGIFANSPNIPQGQTVDSPYTAYFQANDIFGNLVELSDGSVNVFVKSTNANTTFTKDYVGDGYLKVSFQPMIPDTYTISFGNIPNSYSTVITQGAINVANTYGNLEVNWLNINSSLTAGTVLQVQVYPRDQWGNQLVMTQNIISLISYYYNRPGVSGYIVGESSAIMNNDSASLYFNANVTIKGNYIYKVSVNDQEIQMTLSVVNVIPGRAVLNASLVEYLDDESNLYIPMDRTVALKEDNSNENNIPRYLLILADIYGNLYDTFSANPSEFVVIVNGNDYNRGPLQYDSNITNGNALSITINANSLEEYHDGPANTNNFNITWNRNSGVESVVYPIQFLGQNGSNDSEILCAADLSQTWISQNSLQFEAGDIDSFLLEIRCADGKRKADFIQTISFTFSYHNGSILNTGNFNATIQNATLRGRFLVTIYGELANNRDLPFLVKMFVGTGNQIPQTLNLTVEPANLDHITLPSDLIMQGTADNDFVFNVQPYDRFNNVADVVESDINLRIIFPVSSSNTSITSSYSASKDPASGSIGYTVKSRVAGTYQLESSLFVNDQTPSFLITPGAPSVLTTNVVVFPNSSSIQAGDQLSVNIVVMDAYYNKILAGKSSTTDQFLLSQISLGLSQGQNYTKLQLIVDTPNNNLQLNINYTQAGIVTFSPLLVGSPLQCTGCVVNVTPGDIDIESTKFFSLNLGVNYNETRTIETQYGSNSLNFYSQLYDKYGNIQQAINPKANFQLTMDGNAMAVLTFNLSSDGVNTLYFSILSGDTDTFSRLVPRNNYSLSLTYSLNTFSDFVNLTLEIIGTDDGAGNGPYVANNVFIQPQSIMIAAGNTGYLTIVLRQQYQLRYNGLFDLNLFQVNEDPNVVTQYTYNRLTYQFYNGAQNGEFVLEISGIQAFNGTDKKNIFLTINGTQVYNPVVEVIIIPNTPLANNSIILSPGSLATPYDVDSNAQSYIIFQLFDQYNNLFARSDLAPMLSAQIMNDGNAVFSAAYLNDTSSTYTDNNGKKVTVQNNSYVIPFIPVYPPRLLYVQVYYNPNNASSFPITTFPFIYSVDTQLDPTQTAVVGSNVSGVAIGNDFSFTILVKDTAGYCYEETEVVNFRLIGPFANNNVADNTLTSTLATLFNNTFTTVAQTPSGNTSNTTNGYICMKFYQALVPGNIIQITGYYQIEVIIAGVNNNQPVTVIRSTYMTAGPAVAANSELDVPSLYGRGSNPLGLLVNTPMTVLVYLRDSYKNLINNTFVISDNTTYFDFNISGLILNKDFTKNITYLSQNATFVVQLLVMKTGTLGSITATLLGSSSLDVQNDLDKIDFPSSIQILAGPCSVINPMIDYVDTAVAGIKQYMTIQCKDAFNNTVTVGGNSFNLQITGVVDVIGIDVVNANVKDMQNGMYSVEYTFTWTGNYSVLVFLNNTQYHAMFSITVINSVCPDDAPFQCLGNNLITNCSTDYTACGYSLLSGCSGTTPFNCTVNGVSQCVAHRYLCDCDADSLKCSSDQKCVNIFLSNDLCALTVDTNNCVGDFPYQCPDQSCRVTQNECPSYPGCPPGTMMCADETCVDATKTCPTFSACQSGFKCEDQSCVNDINDCPTRITCTNPGWIICPDKTCAENELQCQLPNQCPTDNEGNQLVLCADQSCRNSQSDCPTPVTCPMNMALCEDGSCRTQCTVALQTSRRRILNTYSSGSKLFRLLLNTTDNSTDNSTNTKCPLITCPGGECTDNQYKCPTVEVCPTGYVKCPDLSCASSQNQCLVQVCPTGTYHCWDGNCMDNSSECATRSTCPPNYPVKCHDGSCTTALEKCADFIECPPYSPYRCANGECRVLASECPTLITCPVIRPILCPDNTCQKNKDNCNNAAVNTICPSPQVRCADSSCAYSKDLCPTVQSCTPGQVRCWDNSCADSLTTCPSLEIYSEICPVDSSLRCPDGSCRANLNDCPTQIICPLDSPVKCDDGNCRQSNTLCAKDTQCPSGFKRCPDGSCSQTQNCGTPITCSEQAPFLCYDNTCKIDPRDCPPMPTCSGTAMILCPDGTCVSQRILCQGFDVCESDTNNTILPVRCPDLFCYASRDNCTSYSGCPGTRYLCADGSCATTALDCPVLQCPIQSPWKCPDGFCVSDEKYCDSNVTGCPYNKPYKCNDGSCGSSVSDCPNNNTAVCPNNGDVLCPDGSCAKSQDRCPNALGCTEQTPLMCGNGLCIDPNKTVCPVLNCPPDSPIKCLNGFCAKSITYCGSFIPLEDYAQCANDLQGNNVPCADGRCVASADLCKPLIPCESNSVRCNDKSCRPIIDLCPLAATCPLIKPYRCNGGACAEDSSSCPTVNGCPSDFPWKCEVSGTCVQQNQDCLDTYKKTILSNKCTIDLPYLCPDKTCALNQSNCTAVNQCPNFNAPFLCFDGTCAANLSECQQHTAQCKNNGSYICPDYKCVASSDQCSTKNGCPASAPFQCADGSCVTTPFSLYSNSSLNCIPMVVCPKYRPYLCGDGECQGSPSLCRTQQNCPTATPYRCPDQTCANSAAACYNATSICPQTAPFRCMDGTCVSEAIECQTSNNLYCTDETPFPCTNGQCVQYPFQCVSSDIRSGKVISSRLLANSTTAYNTSIDPGCIISDPHRCYDGTCRANVLDCPLSNGCMDLSAPYKCLTGACVATAQQCTSIDAIVSPCTNNLTLCEDGYCRFSCPQYNGCPNSLPLLCPNGYCARSLSECAGDSACPLLTSPYRCVDNTCVYDRTQCTLPKRSYQSELIHITVSPVSSTTIDFIQAGDNSAIYLGQLIIPAGSVLYPLNSTNSTTASSSNASNSTNTSAELYSYVISPVPLSLVKNATNPIDSARLNYSNYLFPYTDGVLEYHQTLRSSVVQLQTLGRGSANYRFPIVLYLDSDILQDSNVTDDYCMGIWNQEANIWECHSRELVTTTDTMGFKVYQDGTYSVIFNPTPPPAQDQGEPCGFFCEYKMTILYVLIGLVIFSVVFTYLVWRVSRYVTKYREAKKQMSNYREQISELEQAQTDVQGQTIKDKIEGISFTTNPAFKEQSSDMGEKIGQLEKTLESSQKRNNLLEKANKELVERNSILNEEYDTLMKEAKEKQ